MSMSGFYDGVSNYKERRLKDYKGMKIIKYTDEIATWYEATDQNDNLFQVKTDLKELKRNIDIYMKQL